MKTVRTLLVMFLLGFTISLTFQVAKSERYADVWRDRVASLEQREADIETIENAQEYGGRAVEAVRMLAVENGLLCERDAKLTLYVAAMEEENAKLKASVSESVERMQARLEENNELHQEINNLSYKIRCLEQALEAVEVKQPADVDEIKDDILEIFEYLQLVDEAVTALTIIL